MVNDTEQNMTTHLIVRKSLVDLLTLIVLLMSYCNLASCSPGQISLQHYIIFMRYNCGFIATLTQHK